MSAQRLCFVHLLWGATIQISNYDAPLVLIAISYIIIAYRTFSSSKINRFPGQVHPTANGISALTKQQETGGTTAGRRKGNLVSWQRGF